MSKSKKKTKTAFESSWFDPEYGMRFQVFQNLMLYRIRNILLVSSLYDLFLFEEDGRLFELLREEYLGLNLTHVPELTQVSSGTEAIEMIKKQKRFDLIITTLHIEDMRAHDFAQLVRNTKIDIPIVLLAYDHTELSELLLYHDPSVFDQLFIWQGDFRIIIGIIKCIEDKLNVEHDTRVVGVQSIILIEDQVQFYSSYLPMIYMELFKHAQRLISEGISLSHKLLRMRARPKILLCTNYEEAWNYFLQYKDNILGVISDVDFMHNGKQDAHAGIKFARNVKRLHSDIPILLQTNTPENESEAYKAGATFLLKKSSTLLQELRQFMFDHFGFGDFIFRAQDGREFGRAYDLKSLENQIKIVPEESIKYHSERNHFSSWLKARTEFWVAHQLRPRKVSDFKSINALREDLFSSLREYRKTRQMGLLTDFNKESFYPLSSFARVGGGSIGGKARGLSFINKLIYNYKVFNRFENVNIYIPPAIVLGTNVFDQFLDENDLLNLALNSFDDQEITQRFLQAEYFPVEILKDLKDFLEIIDTPLAVRSSSLLEDSQYFPFAGVYSTIMLPNNNDELRVRLKELVSAIKLVYASTFMQQAKNYFKVTSYRLEEEKMAVVIQKMVGVKHSDRFYPDFSGVAKSYNFYPVHPQKSADGASIVALGLGRTVVEGGLSVKFCPKYPSLIPQFNSIEESLKNNQQTFYALNLKGRFRDKIETPDIFVEKYGLEISENDGTLKHAGSTYSSENHAIYDGISRKGHRLVTFAPILKHKTFPLPEILELFLKLGNWAMGTPVEIEFAANLSVPDGSPKEFGILQMRPLVIRHEFDVLDIEVEDSDKLISKSNKVLGNGLINNIFDIVIVDLLLYDRFKSHEVAKEISMFNSKLLSQNRPYLLIGIGRWGSLDPLLGIPVKWEQISGAKTIVETGFRDIDVAPSQGSHFFHNLTSFRIGYFTVSSDTNDGFIDWDWLLQQETIEKMQFTRQVQFEHPIMVKMNGRKNQGIILKPQDSTVCEPE